MTAKVATRNLYVSVVTLLTTLVYLAVQIMRLATKLVLAGIDALKRLELRTTVKACPPVTLTEDHRIKTPSSQVHDFATELRDKLCNNDKVRLETALVGLGFQKTAVRQYVISVHGRLGREPLGQLIKDGLRALAS